MQLFPPCRLVRTKMFQGTARYITALLLLLRPSPIFRYSFANGLGRCWMCSIVLMQDPFIYFDRFGRFHVIAHCYTCYWYPLPTRPGPHPDAHTSKGSCLPGSAFCSGHGFSTTGEAGNWTWIGGDDAPYNFTSEVQGGAPSRAFSTRERPWLLSAGPHGDDFVALINGVSGGVGQPGEYIKFVTGKDWTYTNIQPVAHNTTADK